MGGYHLVERGIVTMKGKGEQQTYWLVGEDPEFRKKRAETRKLRRSESKTQRNGQLDLNGHCIVTRSSLKNKNNNSTAKVLTRCSSFESPKKLRFASGENLENHGKAKKLLECITDSSPCKKSANSLIESSLECCSEAWKTSSTSCPCIENLANSTATLAQSQLSMFTKDDKHVKLSSKPACSSVPVLSSNLVVPKCQAHAISAPPSPRKPDGTIGKLIECDEVVVWAESAPLLKVSKNGGGICA